MARGELEEEASLVASSVRHLGTLFDAYGISSQRFHIFLATDLGQGTQKLSVEEQDLRTEWYPVTRFWELVERGEITDEPTVAAYALFERDQAKLTASGE